MLDDQKPFINEHQRLRRLDGENGAVQPKGEESAPRRPIDPTLPAYLQGAFVYAR